MPMRSLQYNAAHVKRLFHDAIGSQVLRAWSRGFHNQSIFLSLFFKQSSQFHTPKDTTKKPRAIQHEGVAQILKSSRNDRRDIFCVGNRSPADNYDGKLPFKMV